MFYLQVPSTNEKLGDITNAVLDLLSASCAECDITNDIIDEQSFACFPESATYVTYRARLEGTSEINSTSLISLIEEWVSNGSNIVMAGVLMTVDTECSVVISSLSEEKCFPSTESTTINTDSTITVITGGVVAVIFVISLTIAAVIIAVFLIMKIMSVKE